MRTSWWMRWSCRCLWWITDALLRRKMVLYSGSDSENYRRLCCKIGMGALAIVVEQINRFNVLGVVSSFTLPQNPAQNESSTQSGSVRRHNSNTHLQNLTMPPGTFGQVFPYQQSHLTPQMPRGSVNHTMYAPQPTKDFVPVQCLVRRGDVRIRPGRAHEVMNEVDPDRVSAVRWKFTANTQPVAFSATFFRMNHDPDDPIMECVNVVPIVRLATGEGLIEVHERGCLLLRWTNEKPSAFNVVSSWLQTENSVSYEVESVPRARDSYAASAIGLLMLSAGAR